MGKIVVVVAMFAGIAGWAHYAKVFPDFRGGNGLNFGSRTGDIRVDTPHGKRYPGMAYWGETTIDGKRYTTITTYRSK